MPLLGVLDRDRRDLLLSRSTCRHATAGQVIALRGRPAVHLIVVETGAVDGLHETAQGERLRLGRFDAPCVVDKVAVLDGGGYTATWVAATDCRLRLLPAAELRSVIADVPAARDHVIGRLAAQFRERQDRLVRASLADAATRVAAWLADAAAGGATSVPLPGGQQGLAETLGMSRVTVNRALQSLAAERVIRVATGGVVIVAPDQLDRRARDDPAR